MTSKRTGFGSLTLRDVIYDALETKSMLDFMGIIESKIKDNAFLASSIATLLSKAKSTIQTAQERMAMIALYNELAAGTVEVMKLWFPLTERRLIAQTKLDVAFLFLGTKLPEIDRLRTEDPHLSTLLMQVVEWLFWLTVFEWGTAGSHFFDTTTYSETKRLIDLELRKQLPTIAEAYDLLRVPPPANLGGPILSSVVIPADCQRDGFIEGVDCQIGVALDPFDVPTPVCLDSGSFVSSVDKTFLLQRLPAVNSKYLNYPFRSLGIGDARMRHAEYAILDLYAPATLNGRPILVKLAHQFTVVTDPKNPMLLGNDLATNQGMVFDYNRKKVIIAKCQGAEVDLILRKSYIAQ